FDLAGKVQAWPCVGRNVRDLSPDFIEQHDGAGAQRHHDKDHGGKTDNDALLDRPILHLPFPQSAPTLKCDECQSWLRCESSHVSSNCFRLNSCKEEFKNHGMYAWPFRYHQVNFYFLPIRPSCGGSTR